MYRECNYAAPLKAKMELEITDTTTGEVIRKEEEVFLGDFPLMTETGTFIINGAERVIVSQIGVLRVHISLQVMKRRPERQVIVVN